MAQRLTQQRQIYYAVESQEGEDVSPAPTIDFAAGTALLVTNLTLNADKMYFARPTGGFIGQRLGKVGAYQPDPSISFSVELKGSGTDTTPEIHELLKAVVGTPTVNSNATTVLASPAPTTSVFTLASATGYAAGNAIAVETSTADKYEVGWIQSMNGAEVTLTHPLSFTPASGADVKNSQNYKLMDTGHASLAFRIWLDSTNNITFRGCKGSVKLDAPSPTAVPTMTFTFKAISWLHRTGSRPTPTYDSTTPPTSVKFKVGNTMTDIKSISWDLGQQIARKTSQNSAFGTASQLVANRELKGNVQAYDVDEAHFTGWNDMTEVALAHQFGDTQFNIIAYQMPKVQRVKVAYGDDAGLTLDQIDFQANITTGADEVKVAYL